jgi:hypothetical protein
MGSICTAGRCRVLDIAHDDVSACTNDDDCMMRAPGCCACDSGQKPAWSSQLTAINKSRESSYQALVCDSSPPKCDACIPTLPSDGKAVCSADKHCVISR